MRVFIYYPFTDNIFGGANQFLKSLRKKFVQKSVFASRLDEAQVILLNANPQTFTFKLLFDLFRLKLRKKILIMRVDGVISKYRPKDKLFDTLVCDIVSIISDGVVFQSDWGRSQLKSWGMKDNANEVVILNASDPEIFFANKEKTHDSRIRLIAVSWSNNLSKGFRYLKYLDEKLDFKRFKMTFVGNSPFLFKNILQLSAISSEKLADQLRNSDLYIFTSLNDTCSNSLIEALSCGLPALAINSGGNLEILKEGGEIFSNTGDLIDKINRMVINLDSYRDKINLPSIDQVSDQYIDFIERIFKQINNKDLALKKYNVLYLFKFILQLFLWKLNKFIKSVLIKNTEIKIKGIVFDCDGVLVNSVSAKVSGFKRWVSSRYPEWEERFMEYHISAHGVGRRKQLEFFFNEICNHPCNESLLDSEVEILSGFIEKEMLSVFPDKEVIDILRSFDDKGLFLYVLSGTPKQELEKQLNKWQISNCFLKVIGSPTDKTEGLKSILEESGLGREELIFVGDATADAKAASSSNVRFVYLPSSAKMTSGEVWKKITGLSDLERYV